MMFFVSLVGGATVPIAEDEFNIVLDALQEDESGGSDIVKLYHSDGKRTMHVPIRSIIGCISVKEDSDSGGQFAPQPTTKSGILLP